MPSCLILGEAVAKHWKWQFAWLLRETSPIIILNIFVYANKFKKKQNRNSSKIRKISKVEEICGQNAFLQQHKHNPWKEQHPPHKDDIIVFIIYEIFVDRCHYWRRNCLFCLIHRVPPQLSCLWGSGCSIFILLCRGLWVIVWTLCPFSFGRYVASPSIYGFWYSLWDLKTFLVLWMEMTLANMSCCKNSFISHINLNSPFFFYKYVVKFAIYS